METIGARIKQLRKHLNMNQSVFSERLDVSQTHISKLEASTDKASEKLLRRISNIFSVNYVWLTTGVGSMWDEHGEIAQAVDNSVDKNSSLFERISVLSKRLSIHDKQVVSSALSSISYMLSATYTTPEVKSITIKSMCDIIGNTYLLFVEPFRDGKMPTFATFDLREREWRKVCEETLSNLKDEYFYNEAMLPISMPDKSSPMHCTKLSNDRSAAKTRDLTLPVVGRSAAGTPIEMIEENDDVIAINGEVRARAGDLVVIAVGDSMIDAGIHDGDRVIIHPQPEVLNGEIALVAVDNDSTIKRFYRDRNYIRLEPENPAHETQFYCSDCDVRVLGKVIAVVSGDEIVEL